MDNEPKSVHLYVFDYKAYVFHPNKVCANKLVSYFELMIFIWYKDNSYTFMHHIQENIIFYSIHAIFNKEFFSKCTDFHMKEHKLHNKLLDKISPETESLVLRSSSKDESALVPIPHTLIPPIQNNPSPCSSLLSPLYKSLSPLPSPVSKKPMIEIEKVDDVDSDIEMQPLSSQQPLKSALQTL